MDYPLGHLSANARELDADRSHSPFEPCSSDPTYNFFNNPHYHIGGLQTSNMNLSKILSPTATMKPIVVTLFPVPRRKVYVISSVLLIIQAVPVTLFGMLLLLNPTMTGLPQIPEEVNHILGYALSLPNPSPPPNT